MIAVALSALTSMMFGAGDFLGGFASRRAPALAVTLITMLVGFAVLVPAAWTAGGAPSPADYGWSGAAGALGGLGVALLFHVLAVGPVGAVSPVVAVCGVAVPVLAGLAWGERPGMLAIVGIVAAGVAIALVSASPGAGKRHARARVIALAALAGSMLGGFLVCISRIGQGAGLWPLVVARAAGTVMVGAVMLLQRTPPRADRRAVLLCATSAVLDSFANLLYFWIVKQHPLSIVGTIVSLSPATVVLLARLVLHEKFHRRQIAGLALAALAIVLMTAAKR